MNWDIESFLQQLRGGFEPGQEKRDEEQKIQSAQMQDEMKAAELEDKKKKASLGASGGGSVQKQPEIHEGMTREEHKAAWEKAMKG